MLDSEKHALDVDLHRLPERTLIIHPHWYVAVLAHLYRNARITDHNIYPSELFYRFSDKGLDVEDDGSLGEGLPAEYILGTF
jgi:hypothetical protein